MDDFGSGYSSLNILRDIPVDAIKLDMKFMTAFDARTKTMVKGLISIAKQIGIQTLTEGVETEEQYDFLYNIGSEKVQGFYHSKPVLLEEMMNRLKAEPGHAEKSEWRPYYEKISAVDFVTDKALAVFEEMCYELSLRCEPGGEEQSVVYSARDQLIGIHVRCLAAYRENSAYSVEIIDLSGAEPVQTRTEIDQVGRQLFQMYDQVFRGNYHTREVKLIHPDDRQAFMRFFNHADLLLRMREKDDIVLADYFRIRMKNKRYDWKVLRILYLDDTDELIYTVHRSDIVEKYNRVLKDVSG